MRLFGVNEFFYSATSATNIRWPIGFGGAPARHHPVGLALGLSSLTSLTSHNFAQEQPMRLFGVNDFSTLPLQQPTDLTRPRSLQRMLQFAPSRKAVAPLIWPALAQKLRDQCVTRSVPKGRLRVAQDVSPG
jgi:hypothetical protein